MPFAPCAPELGCPFKPCPKLLADCELIPPPVMLTIFFSISIRGSYQNSHDSYVV